MPIKPCLLFTETYECNFDSEQKYICTFLQRFLYHHTSDLNRDCVKYFNTGQGHLLSDYFRLPSLEMDVTPDPRICVTCQASFIVPVYRGIVSKGVFSGDWLRFIA